MSAEERANILNAINEVLYKNGLKFVVVGYDDKLEENGFLEVLIDKQSNAE